jgi:hypothetical protein
MTDKYMTMGEAQAFLSVSKVKMAKLVREGTLKTTFDPLDSRVKLVKLADVKKLKIRDK